MQKVLFAMLFFSVPVFMAAQIPMPLQGNPGNIFTAGQEVSIQIPADYSGPWQLADYDGKTVAHGDGSSRDLHLSALPVGYYQLESPRGTVITTIGVVSRLMAPTPQNSPIAVDTAASWFYDTPDAWRKVASLVSLAGINWIRDRFRWPEMEPTRGKILPHTKYDDSTEIFHSAGLHILDVIGSAPGWTGAEANRFPPDLRDVFDYYKSIAERWRGKVNAFESWNEPDFFNSGAEMASLQKAAYLGFKAGNPSVIVCSPAWASPEPGVEQDFRDNQVSPYFDTFNIHHYIPPQKLSDLFNVQLETAAGKPIWVSEFNLPVTFSGDPAKAEPSPKDLEVQAQRVPKMFAITLQQGTQKAFYFIFGNFVVHQTQYGVVHQDFTPRPAYLALSAVGRLLAGAKSLGEVRNVTAPMSGADSGAVYAFEATPDGQPRDVIVAWAKQGTAVLDLPKAPLAVYDTIGRRVGLGPNPQILRLDGSPQFILLPEGTVKAWASGSLQASSGGFGRVLSSMQSRPTLSVPTIPRPAAQEFIQPSPVVLQALFKSSQLVLGAPIPLYSSRPATTSIERIPTPPNGQVQIYAYNFAEKDIQVALNAAGSSGWKVALPITTLSIPAHGRVPIQLDVTPSQDANPAVIRVRASGPGVGNSILSFVLSR